MPEYLVTVELIVTDANEADAVEQSQTVDDDQEDYR